MSYAPVQGYPLPIFSGSLRATTSAPAAAATVAVSSVQLSATTRRWSSSLNCRLISSIVGTIPVLSLCAAL